MSAEAIRQGQTARLMSSRRAIGAASILMAFAIVAGSANTVSASPDVSGWEVWNGAGAMVGEIAISDGVVVSSFRTDSDEAYHHLRVWVPGNSGDPRNAVLELSDTHEQQGIGSVAIDGSRIAATEYESALHIYDWNGAKWVETVLPEPRGGLEAFGSAVAIDGDRIVVGAEGTWEDYHQAAPGAVFVYQRLTDETWRWDELPRPPIGSSDGLGHDVAIDEGRIVVGNPSDPAPYGSIVVYEDSAEGWLWTRIVAPDEHGEFGWSVDVRANTIVVGAYHSSEAFVYRLVSGEWRGQSLVRPEGLVEDDFGWEVAIDGDVIAVSTRTGWPDYHGRIQLFEAHSGEYFATLAGFDPMPDTNPLWFGPSVDVDGSLIAYPIGYGPWGAYPSDIYVHRIDYGRFIDDQGVFEADIEWLAEEGITKGCNPPLNDRFCPNTKVTRGQMAAFLARALNLTDRLDDPFIDDDDSIFEADIEKLAAAGITKGCNPAEGNTRFCPDDKVTRGQMAAFLVRAMGYTDNGGGNLFIDDDDSVFENDINKLGTAGVTKGCNPAEGNTKFCPDSYVTRAQMAALLHRALG